MISQKYSNNNSLAVLMKLDISPEISHQLALIAAQCQFSRTTAKAIKAFINALMKDGIYADSMLAITDSSDRVDDAISAYKNFLQQVNIDIPDEETSAWMIIQYELEQMVNEPVVAMHHLFGMPEGSLFERYLYAPQSKIRYFGLSHLNKLYWDWLDLFEDHNNRVIKMSEPIFYSRGRTINIEALKDEIIDEARQLLSKIKTRTPGMGIELSCYEITRRIDQWTTSNQSRFDCSKHADTNGRVTFTIASRHLPEYKIELVSQHRHSFFDDGLIEMHFAGENYLASIGFDYDHEQMTLGLLEDILSLISEGKIRVKQWVVRGHVVLISSDHYFGMYNSKGLFNQTLKEWWWSLFTKPRYVYFLPDESDVDTSL